LRQFAVHNYTNGVKGATGSYKGMVKERCGAARASGILYREKTKYEISTYIAVLPDYKGFDWIFASNIEYEKIFSYV